MKKKLLPIIVVLLLIIPIFSLSSCGKSDEKIASGKQEHLVQAIKNKDRAAIKELFAENILDDIENIEQDIEDLLTYLEGDYVSFKAGGPLVEKAKNDGKEYKFFHMSCYIETTICQYRIFLKWYIKDTFDSKNVGIWSLYIYSEVDEPTEPDSTLLLGINVPKPQ